MTSFAFILGCVPLWIATGAGAVSRQIMGTTVIGGMLAASFIGIFIIPSAFYVVEKLSGAARGSRRNLAIVPPPVAGAGRLIPCLGKLPSPRSRFGPAAAAPSARIISAPSWRRPRSFARRSRFRPQQAASLADLKWFEIFKDEQLQALIRTALAQNYDLRDAVARVEAARANLGITRSDQFPQFGASGGVEINRLSRDGATPIPAALLPIAESQLRRGFAEPALVRSGSVGQAAPRHRSRARQSSERGGKSQDRDHHAGQRCGHRLPDAARAGLRARDFQRDAGDAAGIARSDEVAASRAASRRCSTCARPSSWWTPRPKPFR